MVNNFIEDSDNLLLDFETRSVDAISLKESQIQEAAAISSTILNPEDQWQTYLEALAQFGFESWLEARDSQLLVNSTNCSLTQPRYANVIPGVFNLEIAQFKICILTPGLMLDETITIPRAVLDLPEYVAHFYIVVEVDEEREETTVNSFIPYDELKQHQQSANLQPDSDWNYELPAAWFNGEPDKLLLCLRCLEPIAIVLPTVPERLTEISKLQTELESLIPQLQSQTSSLSEILTWEQAISLLTNPDLLDWLHNVRTTPATESNSSALIEGLSKTLAKFTQRVINVGAWLKNELDEVSQNLAWNLLPPSALATSAFRNLKTVNQESPIEELASLVTHFRNSSVEIPSEATSAYRDFTLGTVGLRIFAIAWEINPVAETPEWTLLVILGAQPEQQLPLGLKLVLQDLETTLDEKIVETTEDRYLYTLVIGNLEEKFMIKLVLPTGETLVFPPFILMK